MSALPPGVIGTGQTKYKKARTDVSMPGLLREAAQRALDDAGLDWADIDAVVFGKAPDLFEGVMQPELFMADALGAGGQADAAGAHRRQRGLLDRGGRHRHGAGRALPAGARGRVGEAVRGQRAVGSRRRPQQLDGRRRHLRPVDALLHPAVGRARAHRVAGVGEGPPQRVQEPVRAPAPEGHHHRAGARLADALGPDPLPRVVPVVRRRLRDRGRRPTRSRRSTRTSAWVLSTAMRSELGQFPGRDPVRPQAGVECAQAVYEGAGITDPRRADRRRRAVRAVQLVRADVARGPRHRRARARAGA